MELYIRPLSIMQRNSTVKCQYTWAAWFAVFGAVLGFYCMSIITGYKESANFRFLQRLPVIFGFRRDCPWSLVLLPILPSTKKLPAETVRVILLPTETLGRKLNHMTSLCRKLFIKHNNLGRKQEIADSLGESQIWRTVSAGSETD